MTRPVPAAAPAGALRLAVGLPAVAVVLLVLVLVALHNPISGLLAAGAVAMLVLAVGDVQ